MPSSQATRGFAILKREALVETRSDPERSEQILFLLARPCSELEAFPSVSQRCDSQVKVRLEGFVIAVFHFRESGAYSEETDSVHEFR